MAAYAVILIVKAVSKSFLICINLYTPCIGYTRGVFLRKNLPDKKFLNKIKKYLIITGFLIIGLIYIFESQIEPFEEKCVLKQAKSISNTMINNAILNATDELKYTYSDLAKVKYSDNDEVKAITTVSENINNLKSKVLLNIQNDLDKNEMYYFTLPLGAYTQLTLINNWGPDVEINFRLSGSAKCKIESRFDSAGLNQTVHHIYMVVTTNITVMTPSFTKEKVYKSDYEIAQTVIVGNIPNTFADIDK